MVSGTDIINRELIRLAKHIVLNGRGVRHTAYRAHEAGRRKGYQAARVG